MMKKPDNWSPGYHAFVLGKLDYRAGADIQLDNPFVSDPEWTQWQKGFNAEKEVHDKARLASMDKS